MNTAVLTVRNNVKDPSCYQVKIRKVNQSHVYVVPSSFATIPANNIQKRILKNAYNSTNRSRISFPPSIKEENEEEDVFVGPQAAVVETVDDDDIPLAVLAYRKGFVVPDKVEKVFPLIQHVPVSHHSQINYVPSHHQSLRDPRPQHSVNSVYYHNQEPHLCNLSRYQSSIDTKVINVPTIPYPVGDLKQHQFHPHQQFYQLSMNNSYSSSNSSISVSSSSSDVYSPTDTTRGHHLNKKGFFRRQSSHF